MAVVKSWTVMIVDDQPDIVEAIAKEVDWEKLHVHRLLKAYNAMEAKLVILENKVDIMFCDIEMPFENGLQLYKWTKEKNIDIECIFLTAHADFLYAKSAIQLGSFDYILQPVRCYEIENAVLRVQKKIKEQWELNNLSKLGKIAFEYKNRIGDSLIKDLFETPIKIQGLKQQMEDAGLVSAHDSVICPALIEISEWKAGEWSRELLRFSFANIIGELLEGEKVGVYRIEEKLWCIFIWRQRGKDWSVLCQQLTRFISLSEDYFSCTLVLYLGKDTLFEYLGTELSELKKEKENNVVCQRGVYLNQIGKSNTSEPEFSFWENLLINGYGREACSHIFYWLDHMAQEGVLDVVVTRRFYINFLRMLARVGKKAGDRVISKAWDIRENFDYEAYKTLDRIKQFVEEECLAFDEKEEEVPNEDSKIEQAKEYIFQNLDKNIRREDIAAEIFINPSYLSRIFKKSEGISLKDFIVQEKMKMARSLLKNSKLSVSVIAIKVGYSNFAYFSQVYRKTYGVTPTEDREEH